MNLKTTLVLMVCACAFPACAITDEEGREMLKGALSFVGDCVDASDLVPSEPADVANRFAGLMAETGWDRTRLVDEMRFFVTNNCASPAFFSEADNRVAYERALREISAASGTNCLPFLDNVFRNCCENEAWTVLDGYFRLSGLSHDAVAYASGILLDPTIGDVKKGRAYASAMKAAAYAPASDLITNRVVSLSFTAFDASDGLKVNADRYIVRYWPQYAGSSNRLVNAHTALRVELPPWGTNYFARVLAALESLPPGTMQMLSTNQFCNVED